MLLRFIVLERAALEEALEQAKDNVGHYHGIIKLMNFIVTLGRLEILHKNPATAFQFKFMKLRQQQNIIDLYDFQRMFMVALRIIKIRLRRFLRRIKKSWK